MDEKRKRLVTQGLWALGILVVVLAIVFAFWVGPWLFTRHPHQDLNAEELKAKNDVRTTLVQALAGLAVASGAVVTYRTYRQNRREQDRTYEQNLYAKAIEQLGHEEAPVRLGALYSLATLGQNSPHRRPMVVDVLCAYLRMPYALPPESAEAADVVAGEASSGHRDQPASKRDPAQERQVRLTAQRLLSEHLRRPYGVSGQDAQHLARSPDVSFWPGISLDLTGAYLIGLDLSQASVVDAGFAGATFTGDARFRDATFTFSALFDGAIFIGDALFDGAIFTTGDATFDGATFTGVAWFAGRGEIHRPLREVQGGDLHRRRLFRQGDLHQRRLFPRGDLHRRRLVRGGDLRPASVVLRDTGAEPR